MTWLNILHRFIKEGCHSNLKGSWDTHTGEKPQGYWIDMLHQFMEPFKCEVCGWRSCQKGNLTKHITSVHEGRKPYKCEVCGWRSCLVLFQFSRIKKPLVHTEKLSVTSILLFSSVLFQFSTYWKTFCYNFYSILVMFLGYSILNIYWIYLLLSKAHFIDLLKNSNT